MANPSPSTFTMNINTMIGHGEVDKVEAERDAYTKPGMSIKESVNIALDQAMSKVFANTKDMRDSFAGIGPGVMLGGSKKEMTAKEFCQMMRERREAANGIHSRGGTS